MIVVLREQRQSLIVDVVRELEGFLKLEQDWDRLHRLQSFKTIFQTFQFHRIWWQNYGHKHHLYILTVRTSPQIVCIVPLMLTGRKLEFIGAPNFDYHDLVGHNDGETTAAIIAYLKGTQNEWDEISFTQISERSTTIQSLSDALHDSKLPWLVREADHCLVYEYNGKEEERGRFAVRKGRNYKKAVNHFNRLGGFEIRKVVDAAEAIQLLEQMFHLHIMHWKGTPTPSKFESSVQREFYRQLVNELGVQEGLHMVVQTVAGVPVVLSFNFLMDKTIFHYTLSYSEFFSKRSPGAFFFTAQTEKLVREGYSLDFSRGSQDYKQTLSNGEFVNREICIYASNVTRLIHELYERLKKTSLVAGVGKNRKFQYYRSLLSSRISRYGLIRGLFYVLRSSEGEVPSAAPTIFRKTDHVEMESSSTGEVTFGELRQEESLSLAVLLGIIDESPAYEKLLKYFADGDRFFVARYGNVPVASCRAKKTDRSDGIAPLQPTEQLLLCDLFIAEAFDDDRILPGLLTSASDLTGARYLAEIAPPPGRVNSIQTAGFKLLSRQRAADS